jgi:phosphatidylglycerol---prolipoprotein diacylglyceryl transferase
VIPYFQLPSLFGVIHPFGIMLSIAIAVGLTMVMKRAKQLGLDAVMTQSMVTWGLSFGFLSAHVLNMLAYAPREVLANPLLLVDPRHFSMSSFGGFVGAIGGILLWARVKKIPVLPFGDAACFGISIAWVFGRTGCFLAHDHPGRRTDFFLGVMFPAYHPFAGTRHDLGLYEALFAVVLATAFLIAFRRKPRPGAYLAVAGMVYAPIRFLLDFLRADDVAGGDPRYLGLTPGQYASIAMFLAAGALALRVFGQRPPAVVEKVGKVGKVEKAGAA